MEWVSLGREWDAKEKYVPNRAGCSVGMVSCDRTDGGPQETDTGLREMNDAHLAFGCVAVKAGLGGPVPSSMNTHVGTLSQEAGMVRVTFCDGQPPYRCRSP